MLKFDFIPQNTIESARNTEIFYYSQFSLKNSTPGINRLNVSFRKMYGLYNPAYQLHFTANVPFHQHAPCLPVRTNSPRKATLDTKPCLWCLVALVVIQYVTIPHHSLEFHNVPLWASDTFLKQSQK